MKLMPHDSGSRPGKEPLFIDFKNITVASGDRYLLNSVTLKISSGEHIAILGPNGSGKTSLIKTIIREYYPVYMESGTRFRIWGEDTWDVFTLRSHFGFVSQDLQYTFNRNITGHEVILSGFFSSIGLFFHQVTRDMENKADEISRFLEISHLMERPITEMSSGEARRVLIGRALVHDPKVLILDEPSNSLDLHALHTLRLTMRKIAEKTVIILVTHNLPDIIPEISRIILLKNGTIIKDGIKKDVLKNEYISTLFDVPLIIREEGGYYYATGY